MKKIALAIALAAALTTMTYAKTPSSQDQTTTKKPKKAKKAKKAPKKDGSASQSK
jgi:hypothetical protein